jgi:hypothetical protein
MAVVWTQTTAGSYHLTLKRGQLQTVALMTSIKSETQEDVDYSDGEWYRDEIDAAFLGAPRTLLVHETGGVSPADVVISNGSNTNVVGSSGTTLSFPTGQDPYMDKSDSVTHEPLRKAIKTMTKTLWWGGESGAAPLIGWTWTHEIYSFLPVEITKVT